MGMPAAAIVHPTIVPDFADSVTMAENVEHAGRAAHAC